MPEGPSIVILKESVKHFDGKKILEVSGNSKTDKERLLNKTVKFKSWGKHFLICCKGFYVRIHFLLFGSYRIDEQKPTPPRLSLRFKNGELNFYAYSVRIEEGDPDDIYDWTGDVMNESWDAASARRKLKAQPEMLVCDALLNQDVFAGVGNIIKNEVLYRIRVHPESHVGKLPVRKVTELINEAVKYSFQFYEWKKNYELKKHWLAHTKKICKRCNLPMIKKHLGKTNRRTFYCVNCQKLYK